MPDYYWLTPDDREFLDDMKRRMRSQMPPPPRYTEQAPAPYQPPEVYIARTPAGGIPALTRVTGDPPEDLPGVAVCDIYTLIKDHEGQRAYIAPHPGNDLFARPIYNLNLDPIGANRWVLVERDKDGAWWARLPWPFPSQDDTVVVGPGGGTTSGTGTGAPGGGVPNDPDIPFPPGDCDPVYVEETELRCDPIDVTRTLLGGVNLEDLLDTGTGGDFPFRVVSFLNEYKRRVWLNLDPFTGCLVKAEESWRYVRTVSCCFEDCTYPDTGTALPAAEDCCPDGYTINETVSFQLDGAMEDVGCIGDCVLTGELTRQSGQLLWTNGSGTQGCAGNVVLAVIRVYCQGDTWRASGTLYRSFTPINVTFNTELVVDGDLFTGTFPLGGGCGNATLSITKPCEEASVPGTIATDCCPDDLLPETLTLTMTSANCACLPTPVTLSWSGTDWRGDITETDCTGGGNNTIILECNAGVFELRTATTTCLGITTTAMTKDSCNPLQLTLTTTNNPAGGCTECTSGDITFTITE